MDPIKQDDRTIVELKEDWDIEGVFPRARVEDPVVTMPCGMAVPKGTRARVLTGADMSYPDILLEMGLIVRGIPAEALKTVWTKEQGFLE